MGNNAREKYMFLKARLKLRYKKRINREKTPNRSHDLKVLGSGHCVSWQFGIRSILKHSIPKYMNAMLSTVCSVLDAGY